MITKYLIVCNSVKSAVYQFGRFINCLQHEKIKVNKIRRDVFFNNINIRFISVQEWERNYIHGYNFQHTKVLSEQTFENTMVDIIKDIESLPYSEIITMEEK